MAMSKKESSEYFSSLRRVKIPPHGNGDGNPSDERAYKNVFIDANGDTVVFSNVQPEEVCQFGLPLGPREVYDQSKEIKKVTFTSPVARSITETREDGLCSYCQLLLLPDAPEFALHQPCIALLIENKDSCLLCNFINKSIWKKCPQLLEEYDAQSPDTCITIQSQRFENHSRIIASCGDTLTPISRGVPLIWTTPDRLAHLKDRKIWEPYYIDNPKPAINRLNVPRNWLRECEQSHAKCKLSLTHSPERFPTRLVKVMESETEEDPLAVQLCEMSNKKVKYVAFSHCWGSTGPLRTTRENLQRFKERIPFYDLPLSFQDAIAQAYFLDFEYVWIDSLCIVQDDKDEWETETARMADVYSNAAVTFANTASSDSSQGCQPSYSRPFPIPLDHDVAFLRYEDNDELDSEGAALNTRGWALQEAVLSRRVICFDDNQLLWKCCELHESEDGLRVSRDITLAPCDWNLDACVRKLDGERKSSYRYWYNMMESYSDRRFTLEEDRLPALAGIATAFNSYIADISVAGLWRKDLACGLAWHANKAADRVRAKGILPSWSWLSVRGPVSWFRLIQVSEENQVQLISVDIEWESVPMTSALLKAEITVRGRIKKTKVVRHNSFHYLHESDHDHSDAASGEAHVSESPLLGYCRWDTSMTMPSDVWCLEVCHGQQRQDATEARSFVHLVLILVESGEKAGRFQRVGLGWIWRQPYSKVNGQMIASVKESFHGVGEETITII